MTKNETLLEDDKLEPSKYYEPPYLLTPTDDDEQRFKTLFDYTKFHIGLYTTLVSLVFVLMGIDALAECAVKIIRYPLALGILLIAGAGACGGLIATHIPIRKKQSFSEFLFEEKVGWHGKEKFFVKRVIHAEHHFFWAAVLVFLICALLLLFSDGLESLGVVDLTECKGADAG